MKLPPARATASIAVATAACWTLAALLSIGDLPLIAGFVPARIGGTVMVAGAVPAWLTPLSATLVHAGVLHVAGNLLMLGYCGRFVEPAIGRWSTAGLYVVGAYAGAAAQYAASPSSLAPMVGASGAISAIVGAYAVLFGRRRPNIRNRRLGDALHILWLAAAWIVLQLLIGYAISIDGAAIAVAAHVGGFVAGLVLARPLLLFRYRHA